jgi:tRNA(Ile)-lysidine synthase
MVARVRGTIERRSMLKGGETVVVAVSGGPDSLTLLHVLARLRPSLDLALHVAHFDHRLRASSGGDAAFVARAAERLGLPATVRAASTTDRLPGTSPEESARERRYAFLQEVADAAGAHRIATGHTLDDQAETVLMRVLAGTGTHGLGGIPPVRGRVVRPLIDVARAETEGFCRAARLRPRRDPTNADPAFYRNAVRAELVPLLVARFNLHAPEALARLADLARDEDALLDELAAAAVELEEASGASRIPVDRLLALPPALARRVLRRAAPLDARQTERVLRLAREGRSGDEVHLPGRLNARLEYGSLLLGRAPSRPVPVAPVALEVPGITDLPPWSMRLRSWISTRAPSGWPDGRAVCVLDADRARPPLAVRRPRAGDRFHPFGMRGSRKLSDFFTDAKLPRADRARVGLVVAGEDIVWVVGHRLDDRFKVTPRTRRFLWLEEERGGA